MFVCFEIPIYEVFKIYKSVLCDMMSLKKPDPSPSLWNTHLICYSFDTQYTHPGFALVTTKQWVIFPVEYRISDKQTLIQKIFFFFMN